MALLPVQGLLVPATAAAQVRLADQPVFASNAVPGNLALALSVEYPTATRMAHTSNYSTNNTFLGYFDPNKCYTYQRNTATYVTDREAVVAADNGDLSYFQPAGLASTRSCTGAKWSGNFLNWATMAAIDPFRWAMTGGNRVVDTTGMTILQKGWHSSQGSSYFPNRTLSDAGVIAGATPYKNSSSLAINIGGRGFAMRITPSGGMQADYYRGIDLAGTAFFSNPSDSAHHAWGNGGPGDGSVVDNFSARYTGRYTAPAQATYTFRVTADDGVRLFVNNTQVINQWKDQGATSYEYSKKFGQGESFDLKVEYYEKGGGATMQLEWRQGNGNYTVFTESVPEATATDYTVRVRVCDPSAAAGGLEANCKAYGSESLPADQRTHKPEGLVQKYSQDMRFSAFGYLNDHNVRRDGGVLRARQKFVAPQRPVPGQPSVANAAREWDPGTGIFVRNPDSTDASATVGDTIQDSGVINYLNKFGQLLPGTYKSADPVNELYYAALRYYRNLGNVSEWSDLGTANAATKKTWLDGFPVINTWDDPVQYSCQRNFILGIGDIYTHRDKNVPGNTATDDEPPMPAAVSSDTWVNAMTATNQVGTLQGIANLATTATGSSQSRSYMAGLAYYANTKDIRPDDPSDAKTLGKQTIQTYWVDVLEQPFVRNNKFYLAAKFGGMKVPSNFDPYTFAGEIPLDWWSTNGEFVGTTTTDERDRRPDNYFTAGRPDTMVSGLTRAFEDIVGNIKAFTTSFSLAGRQLTSSNDASYATQYDSANWSGELTGSRITTDAATGTPLLAPTPTWSTSERFENQLGTAANATGWDTERRIVTWNPDRTNGGGGAPFRIDAISENQKALLDTTYVAGDDSANYLKWLRGDTSLESKNYRARYVTLSTGVKRNRLGDIVNSKVTVVGAPPAPYSETANPGYRAFKETHKNRQTMLYFGANDGMLHAFKGGLSNADAGTELFAYIPSVLFQRNPTDATAPTNDGLLAQLGRPQYAHRNYVDATAKVYDIDFNNAAGAFNTTVSQTGTTNASWHSVLIGGLGKGGRSYYAIDVTDPSAMTTEEAVAGKVLWEFPARSRLPAAAGGDCAATRTDCIDMGYSYGEPIVVKTAKYGWVVIFTSGYNNIGGKGHLFIVNPTNGALLEDISTGATLSSGMARPTAYVRDYTDMTADSVYVGDLGGQLWRFDLSAARDSTGTYPAPTKIAQLTSDGETAQPITSRPLVEIHPVKRKRFVLVGTGRLLHESDISDSQIQTFYAIIDGGITAFSSRANDNEAWPVTRASLLEVEDPTVGVNTDGKAGWRLQLHVPSEADPTAPNAPEAPGWRVVGDQADAYNGIIGVASFPTVLPTGDVCSPSGLSRAYALNYATGKTVLTDNLAYMSFSSVITDLNFLTIRGKTRLVAGDNKGAIQTVPGNFGDSDPRRLSWREIPVGN